ncbi:hypothetical protein SD427_06785 [Chryseobacterium sp. JJR-5R]|uniref:hypothetical protein n=1 Tax=Chryseobacterium sp. JJR-5R TaxID=3093923 RepID=UPI002A754E22|nr:hypothetical protein [Chryseobacterium sp. JJR-5R]WPO84030.1 hypothetical protein SD427_06785 [Chryseobacterium sp. JJR-5R]
MFFNANVIFLSILSVHFALMQNEPKDQDLDSSAKNKACSLKILNLRDNRVFSSVQNWPHASNTRIFLTFTGFIFFTLQTPMSFLPAVGGITFCSLFKVYFNMNNKN